MSRRSPAGVWKTIIVTFVASEIIPIITSFQPAYVIQYTATKDSIRFVSTKKFAASRAFLANDIDDDEEPSLLSTAAVEAELPSLMVVFESVVVIVLFGFVCGGFPKAIV